jgi:hypothetical protein
LVLGDRVETVKLDQKRLDWLATHPVPPPAPRPNRPRD